MRRFFATSDLRLIDSPKRRHEKDFQRELRLLFDSNTPLQEKLLNALRLVLHVVAIGLIVFNDIFDSSLSKLALNAIEWASEESNHMEFRF